MKFLQLLSTIGKDIEIGLTLAVPIVGKFDPSISPILTEIEQILNSFTTAGITLTTAQVSAVTRSVATQSAIKQSASSPVIIQAGHAGVAGPLGKTTFK